MNERIKELAALCYETGPIGKDGWPEYSKFNEQKFAELIVRECVQTLRDNTPVLDEYESEEDWDRGYGQAMKDCIHHIQEHFGVER